MVVDTWTKYLQSKSLKHIILFSDVMRNRSLIFETGKFLMAIHFLHMVEYVLSHATGKCGG